MCAPGERWLPFLLASNNKDVAEGEQLLADYGGIYWWLVRVMIGCERVAAGIQRAPGRCSFCVYWQQSASVCFVALAPRAKRMQSERLPGAEPV